MPNDMVAIQASKLPAHLQGKVKQENKFAAAVSVGGFPHVSIKGKVFHITRGDEKKLVTNADNEPAASLTAVIIAANPVKSKVYYAGGFEEGSATKPDCYSNDSLTPASDAENPQAKNCAVCPHAQWGSRITDNGGRGKACSDSMRLAISPVDQLNDPMLIRVPAASLKTLGQYGSQLAKREVEPKHVITRIGFDHSMAYPALTFKAVDFVTEEQLAAIEDVLVSESETIDKITGLSGGWGQEEEATTVAAPAPVKSETLVEAEEEAAVVPKAAVKVDQEPAQTASVDDYDNIQVALDNINFDDDE